MTLVSASHVHGALEVDREMPIGRFLDDCPYENEEERICSVF
jgi:hypothetical protein